MWSAVGSFLAGFIFKALKPLFDYLERRRNIAQGKMEQHAADADATVESAEKAAKARNDVEGLGDSALDDQLQQLRDKYAPGDK